MSQEKFEKTKREYNDIMLDYGYEHMTIGTRFSEDTENWGIKEMVEECRYRYETCYEEGHANSEGRYPDYIKITGDILLNRIKLDYAERHNKREKEGHDYWLMMTRRLRNFIKKYA